MPIDYARDAEVLKAVAHPVRLRIVQGLMRNECNVTKIVRALGLPQSTVSQHLGVLRAAGILVPRKSGVKTCYQVVDGRVMKIIEVFENKRG
ncbi:MAG: metalloregulator ArsR/SmtB family transcription factor [Candidatus Omnitrophota bacterium]